MRKIINVFLAVSITFLCCEINGGNDMAPNAKPDKLPEFASTDVVDGVTGQNNVVEPPEAKKDAGWNFSEKPSRNWMNWIHRKSWQWLVYFNQFFSSTHQFKINEIVEFDTDSGVTIDGSLIKDGDIKVDTITEKTTDSGVTIDGINLKGDDGINLKGDDVEIYTKNDGIFYELYYENDNGDVSKITGKSIVSAYLSSNQSVSTGITDIIIFDTEDFDLLSEYDNSTGLFTANEDGKYLCTCNMTAGANAFNWQFYLYKNSTAIAYSALSDSGGLTESRNISFILNLTAGDTVSFRASHSSGGSQSVIGSSRFHSYMSISRL